MNLELAWKEHHPQDAQGEYLPSATYRSYCLRMLDEKPDMFKPWDDVKVDDIFLNTSVDAETGPNEECSTCNRRRNSWGMGNVFCHICSGVDDQPLPEHFLQP